MLDQEPKNTKLYKYLGTLFYAIAASDGVVRNEESHKLIVMLHEHWANTINAQDLTTINKSFKKNVLEQKKAEPCFNDFIDFKERYPAIFNDNLKLLILKTAHAIAASFSAKNKSELILLGKLSIHLRS